MMGIWLGPLLSSNFVSRKFRKLEAAQLSRAVAEFLFLQGTRREPTRQVVSRRGSFCPAVRGDRGGVPCFEAPHAGPEILARSVPTRSAGQVSVEVPGRARSPQSLA